ncbi:hypothetical protein DPMN_079380 [Dreissena polymorpha]|uniref:Uncharacterized protein n=1 Tax=Dreissena polymorpha TaxID=45954 RepID=A0A9D3YNY9_DREPO|nr:hypothetical protein DPMN_079380 [Dreissena polymorpha]
MRGECVHVCPVKEHVGTCEKLAHTVYMYDTMKGTSRAVTYKNIQEPRCACVCPVNKVLVCNRRKNSPSASDYSWRHTRYQLSGYDAPK